MPDGSIQQWVAKRLDDYKDDPKWRSIVSIVANVVPVLGPSLDAGITATIARQQQERLRVLCEELYRLDTPLTEKQSGEWFVYCVGAIVTATLRTWRHEKIKLYARLLHSTTEDRDRIEDSFEEYFDLVQSMSWREIHVLLVLHEFEQKNANLMMDTSEGPKPMPPDRRAIKFWPEFVGRTETECHVKKDEFSGFMNRLNRTGLFKTFGGAILGGDIDNGRLTPMFGEFRRWLLAVSPEDVGSPSDVADRRS